MSLNNDGNGVMCILSVCVCILVFMCLHECEYVCLRMYT